MGTFTNHSLRRTAATRMFNNGASEQEIMSVTGHRTVDGVRNYKVISESAVALSTQPIIFGSENRLNEILTCIKSVKCLNQWYLSTRLISA